MNDRYLQLVKAKYDSKGADHSDLFETILSIAEESSLDVALACLERCVTDKRTAWLDQNLPSLKRSGNAIDDAFTTFYEGYLGISPPEDGEIVERTPSRMVTRWWNPCPTLGACQKFGLDTREVCRKAYHQPVQVFLARIDPRLRFERNYHALRPHTPYCEEILTLVDQRRRP
jgi:tRNA(adenine34) deaminase